MNTQIRKIIRELSYKRTEKVFFHKEEDYWYVGTNVFVLKIHTDDYENMDQKDKDSLNEIIDEKGVEQNGKLYQAMFDETTDIHYTGFLTHVKNRLLAIYDMGDHYAFLDQDVTLDVDPAKFNKVAKHSILIANLSELSQFAAVELKSQEAANRTTDGKYFTKK